jgi:hypothetical protein
VDQRAIDGWKTASADLGPVLRSSHSLTIPGVGDIDFPILIERFGSPNSIPIFDLDGSELLASASVTNYAYCALQSSEYLIYDRDKIVERLEHWGWYRPQGEWPAWCRDAGSNTRMAANNRCS